jgi:PAS domain S-box-containing protein
MEDFLMGAISGITRMNQTEKELEENDRKNQIVIEMSPDAIVILQGQYCQFANTSFSSFLGYTEDDIANGLCFYEIVQERDREAVREQYDGRLSGKEVLRNLTIQLVAKDGRIIPCETSATVIDYNGSPADLVVIHDITDQKLAEREMQRAHREIERRVKERTSELREALKLGEFKNRNLEATITALKTLLEKREEEKIELEEKMITNVNQLILPYLEKLKDTKLDELQTAFLSILESNLRDIASPFLRTLASQISKLTPTEIQVAELIRQGKRTMEIGELMNLSWTTIKTHRRNIRSKLDLQNKKKNLRSYLMSYQL